MSVSNVTSAIRLAAVVDPPIVNECFDQYPTGCPKPGYEIEYIYTIVHDFLQLSIEWVKVESTKAIEQMMDNATVDMLGWSFRVNKFYIDKWGYSQAYMWDGVAMVVKETVTDKSESTLLTGQFTTDLWLALLLCTIVIVAIDIVTNWLRLKTPGAHSMGWPVIAFCYHSKGLHLVWFVFISIVLDLYSNLMTIDLLSHNRRVQLPFASMDELGDKLMRKQCKLVLLDVYYNDEDEFYMSVINPNHNNSWAWKFRKAYETNKPILVSSREELASVVLNETNKCFVGLDWLTIDIYYTSRWCNVKMIAFKDEPRLQFPYAFYATKSDLRETANTVIASGSVQSYPDVLAKQYYYRGYMPNCNTDVVGYQCAPLNLNKMQDGFYFLLFGLAFSMVKLAMARLCSRCFKL